MEHTDIEVIQLGRKRSISFGYFPILLFLAGFLYLIMIIEMLFAWLASLSGIAWVTIATISITIIMVIHVVRMHKKSKEEKINKLKAEEEAAKRKLLLRRQGTLTQLKRMKPLDFEYFICDLFTQMGYDAQVTKATGDGGKDIELRKGEYSAIVECKRYDKTKVTRPKIQQFHSAVLDCKAERGFFITTGEFTSQARNYTFDKPIELINGHQLVKVIEKVTDNQCTFDNFGNIIKEI
ncbi:restriction endonuclease [Halobacillus salinarum]|uniref:Restriction endonuclease n=1 Tax=Halobacillus salinarum TaxID=2932257 RepID=A0ABY4EH15_9BACI|nr:restriction endonuclease [Halobacillus salinarum]UOQ43764.1 restriction endonuclease [Halobacillus salinarum]